MKLFFSSLMSFLIILFQETETLAAISHSQNAVTPNLGFKITEAGTDWEETPPPPESSSILHLFRSKVDEKNTHATLTVRVDSLEKSDKDLKDFYKRWIKEYPKFGYNVLGTKTFHLDGRSAYVIDLISSASSKQARQVISENNRKVVILSCLDEKDRFNKSLSSCNQIIKNFSWVKEPTSIEVK